MRTSVRIERVVLDGVELSRRERDALGPAIARELRRLAGEPADGPAGHRAETQRVFLPNTGKAFDDRLAARESNHDFFDHVESNHDHGKRRRLYQDRPNQRLVLKYLAQMKALAKEHHFGEYERIHECDALVIEGAVARQKHGLVERKQAEERPQIDKYQNQLSRLVYQLLRQSSKSWI